jgi:4a-hydroxytetrahydrobiopterin dehydratase
MTLLTKQCSSTAAALGDEAIARLLPQVPGWSLRDGKLVRSFALRDYHQTIEFVNALAWMTHRQDHHPELAVTYNRCTVSYNTHSAGGAITENDFICAQAANAIYDLRAGA